jgi:hypothetical protein
MPIAIERLDFNRREDCLAYVMCVRKFHEATAEAVPEYADAVIPMKHVEALAIGEAMRFDHLGLVNCSFHKVLKDGKLVACLIMRSASQDENLKTMSSPIYPIIAFYPADPTAILDNVSALDFLFGWLKNKGFKKAWFRAPPGKVWFLDKLTNILNRKVCEYPGSEYRRKYGIPKAWDVYEVQLQP